MMRKLAAADRAVFLELCRRFYDSDSVLAPIPQRYFEATFTELLRSDAYLLGFLLEYEGAPAGYALFSKSFSPEAGGAILWGEELFVLPEFRGCGLGREALEWFTAQKGYAAVRLRLEVAPAHKDLIALYSRFGFERLDYVQMISDAAENEEGRP